MIRPCIADHPNPGDTSSGCRLCHLYTTRDDYRELWDAPPPDRAHRRVSLPCIHEGAVREWCTSRQGDTAEQRHVRDCERHELCTRSYRAGKTASCDRCPDYSTPESPTAVVTTAGIGDFIAVEATLRPDERERIEVVYNAAVAGDQVEEIIRALPGYPNLKRVEKVPIRRPWPRSLDGVRRQTNLPFPTTGDLSIVERMSKHHAYTSSSALTRRLADMPPDTLPDRPFVVVCPRSTWHTPQGRNFVHRDWVTVWNTLDRHDLLAVLICGKPMPYPKHPRVIDRQGQLSITQSIEVLKKGDGYMGVDSWPSVLAAKLFPLARLSVKCQPNSHGWRHSDFYFAPWTEFPFRTKYVRELPWT